MSAQPILALFLSIPDTTEFILQAGNAYLDPGSGSLIIQMLVAVIAGALFMGKLYWQRIKNVFVGKSAQGVDEDRLDG